MSLAVKTSYSQVYDIVKTWAPTRFLAAMVNDQDYDCSHYVNIGL